MKPSPATGQETPRCLERNLKFLTRVSMGIATA
jgi:hypothetical protein